MDLWIRSSLGLRLIPIKDELNISQIESGTWCIFYRDNAIAGYKTEERALEILNEIQESIRMLHLLKISGNKFDNDLILENKEEFIKLTDMIVYEMPKE